MRLALDAMGGDDAPRAMAQGAIDYALLNPSHTVVLVGRQKDVEAALAAEPQRPKNIEIEDAPDVIGMGDKIQALKEKPNDSMTRAAKLVKQGKADAMILCGNTACSVAVAQLYLRRVPGVKRAGLLTPLPTPKGKTWVCDCGANAVGKPEHLVQFAEMASAYLRCAYNIPAPRVGVLSIGEEDGKGDDLTHETLDLLRKTNLNVIGNVEGHHIFTGELDIVVCDGFTGNVMLKASEGVLDALITILKEEIYSSVRTKVGALMMKPAFKGLRDRTHWSLVGGVLLVGVDGVTIIGHGRSDRIAVFHALNQAARAVETKVMAALHAHFKAHATTAAAVPSVAN